MLRQAFAFSLVSMAAAAGAWFVGCSESPSDLKSTTANIVEDDSGLRRVCPSGRNPDGGWITVDGLDTSDYQFVDWDKVVRENPQHKFAFSRVSAGLVREDTRFAIDWPALKRVGLIRGAYQYFKPSQSAVAQADLFLRRLREAGGLEETDFSPVFDVETTNGMPTATVECRLKIWLARVERETRRLPIIYSSHRFNAILPPAFARYPLWVPAYVQDPLAVCPPMPEAWTKWKFWQHSDRGTVWGVYTNAARNDGGAIALQDGGDGGPEYPGSDVNFFDGTLDQLRAFVASTVDAGTVADPPPLANPPHVNPSSPDVTGPVDCNDGCCVIDH